MLHLPMYSGSPTSPVDDSGVALDRSCTKCAWSAGDGRACLPADGRPGGLLVVGDAPVKGAVRPFASRSGAYVRDLVAKSWKGPVVYDYAVKCPGKGAKLRDAAKSIKECRPYLAQVVAEAAPERVLAVGAWAANSLLGRSLDLESTRRGYGWVLGDVPVYVLAGPMQAIENKFYRRRYEEDFRWALTTKRPSPSHVSGVVHVVQDDADALVAERALELHDELLFDVETAGIPHGDDFTMLCAGLAAVDESETDSWVWSADALASPGALGVLRRFLETKMISGSNIKYDAIAAKLCLGIDVARIGFDTQLVRKLLDPMAMGRLSYVVELVGMGGSKEEADQFRKRAVAALRRKKPRPDDPPRDHWCSKAILAGAKADAYSFGLLPEDLLWRYNGRDVASSAAGTIHLRARAASSAPRELACWEELYRPAVRAFERIERAGIPADRQALETFSSYLQIGMQELREKFRAYGPDFNPNATKQVAHVLFDRLRLPRPEWAKSEKTGDTSTNHDVLDHLRGMHPFVDDMIEWRRLDKMDGTYGAGLIKHIRPDGRIHTTFRIDGTETGRVSSENPNSQNWPRAETVEGKMCRDCFTSSPGRILIELDQSQIELRVAAGMSGDPDMIDIFRSGQDYHFRTAQLIARIMWNIAEEAVGEFHRQYCKCFHPDTEVLTSSGWKKISSLSPGEEVMAAQPSVGGRVDLRWEVPTEVFTKRHPSGKLIHFKNEGIDIRVTPDHRMLGFGAGVGKPRVELAREWTGARYWANAGTYSPITDGPGVPGPMLQLAVATQADGSVNEYGQVMFGFTKRRKIVRLDALLRQAGVPHTRSVRDGVTRYYVSRDAAAPFLDLLDSPKSFPWSWLELGAGDRALVVSESRHWGSHAGSNWRMFRYGNRDEQSVDVLQALASTIGRKTRKVEDEPGLFGLSIKDHHTTRSGNLSKIEEDFADEVACLSVPSTFVLVRSGGIPVITGQTVNFGLLYGKTDGGLAEQLGCTIEYARKIRMAILGRFKMLAQMIKNLLHQVRTHGSVAVPWIGGNATHVRPLYEAGGHDKWKRMNAENSSINCLDAETEALTKRGWVRGFDLASDDILLTKNPKTGALEWQGMTDLKLWPDYEGPVVEFRSKSFHAVTTPNHRWLVRDKRTGLDVERTTRTLSQWGDHRIHRTGDYRPDVSSVLTPDEAELLGWFVTDGSVQVTARKRGLGKRGPKMKAGGVRAMICQSQIGNPDKCARIDALLKRLGHVVSRTVSRAGEVFWRLDHALTETLVSLAPDRMLTVSALLRLDRPCLDRLREAMLLGDGTRGSKDVLCTGRREQAEAFQILCTMTGSAASIVWRDMSMYAPQSPKMSNVPKMTGVWLVAVLRRETAQVIRSQRVEVTGKFPVWCPIVPNTFFVARRSGTVYVTGNTPVQGRAAWYTLASLPLILDFLDEAGVADQCDVVNTVHDSIILDCEPAVADAVISAAQGIMESFDCWGVPLRADVKAGTRWGSLRKVKRGELIRDAEVRWVAEALQKEGA